MRTEHHLAGRRAPQYHQGSSHREVLLRLKPCTFLPVVGRTSGFAWAWSWGELGGLGLAATRDAPSVTGQLHHRWSLPLLASYWVGARTAGALRSDPAMGVCPHPPHGCWGWAGDACKVIFYGSPIKAYVHIHTFSPVHKQTVIKERSPCPDLGQVQASLT